MSGVDIGAPIDREKWINAITLVLMSLCVCVSVSTFIHFPWMFSPTDTIFFYNGLDNTEWASFISDLHTKLRTIGRGIPGFAIASPCGAWGCGWTICLLYDGPFAGGWFLKKWQLVCKFGIVERILFILFWSSSCLSVFLHYLSFACHFPVSMFLL